ncbi:amidohydrolase family protein [Luteimonas sp. MJ246]|jgi:imidazolonepropionase-like amidohydrolase|uniref:amidohydrolase family protein n=1 Tax=Luteimonas sp. MJ174 TaxID=3129237 RepID=UPI0031BB67AB
MRRFLRYLLGMVAGLVAIFALGVLWPSATAPLPDAADSRLIRNARIIDVERAIAGEPTDVLIKGGTISRIGYGLRAAPDLPVLEADGRYLLPGFWDMHTHAFKLSPQLHLPLAVANGITGTRDLMDCPGSDDTLIACVADKRHWTRAAIEGRMVSPRFVEVASFYFERADMTPDQAARLAADYRARGLDALKVYNRLSPATYKRLTDEARLWGMPVVGHLPKAVSLDNAVAAGQRSFEHGHVFARHCFRDAAAWRSGALDAEVPTALVERMVTHYDAAACARAFAQMREAGTSFVPTHVTREEDARARDPAFTGDPRLAFLDPLSRWAYRDDLKSTVVRYPAARGEAALRGYFEHGLALTHAAYRAGVPVLVGTDTAIGGFRYHDEMALLVRAGLSPAEVLRAATLDAARYAGQTHRHGRVAVGNAADLVLLEANPLDDIAHTRGLYAVLLAGRLYDRPRLDALLDFTRAQARSPVNATKLVWGFSASSVNGEL